MTIISTVITSVGIIQMSDSFVTYRDGSTKKKPKLFEIPTEFGGVAAVAGCYQVAGEEMETWLPSIADDLADTSLESFARRLGRLLEVNTTQEDRDDGFLIHVAGYERSSETGLPSPEMWFVRNIAGMDLQGEYEGRTQEFQVTEDFWPHYTEGLPDAPTGTVTIPAQFMNGFTPGRVAFNEFGRNLFGVFRNIWEYPGFDFDPPSTLEEMARVFELQMKAVCVLASMSHYEAPLIGEPIQLKSIHPPVT
jgi:hypothetical protein